MVVGGGWGYEKKMREIKKYKPPVTKGFTGMGFAAGEYS